MRFQSKVNKSLSQMVKNNIVYRQPRDNKENNNSLNIVSRNIRPKEENRPNVICQNKHDPKASQPHSIVATLLHRETFSDRLKKEYTQNVLQEYSGDIIACLKESSQDCEGMLADHEITSALRAKMIDWMIEVLSSYKMTEESFFRSVYLMDTYMLKCRNSLEIKDLHLIGLTAMFTATKYEEIHPLKLNTLFDKIARKKFTKTQILRKESEIVQALDFKLENVSAYDIARHIVQSLKLQLSENSLGYLSRTLLYLSKMALFNVILAEMRVDCLAGSVIFIALKTLEQVDSSIKAEEKIMQICTMLDLSEKQIIQASKILLELAKNYSAYFPTLTNLKKFNNFDYGSK